MALPGPALMGWLLTQGFRTACAVAAVSFCGARQERAAASAARPGRPFWPGLPSLPGEARQKALLAVSFLTARLAVSLAGMKRLVRPAEVRRLDRPVCDL